MKTQIKNTTFAIILFTIILFSFNSCDKEQSVKAVEEIEAVQKVDFSQIEQVPVYPGCEEAKDQKQCMSNKITQLIAKSFNVDLAQNLDLKTGKHRIITQFMINNKGKVSDIKVKAPHPKLEEETRRIINLIPKMKPGMQDGKAVKVRYNLPIIFKVED